MVAGNKKTTTTIKGNSILIIINYETKSTQKF